MSQKVDFKKHKNHGLAIARSSSSRADSGPRVKHILGQLVNYLLGPIIQSSYLVLICYIDYLGIKPKNKFN